jgi:hypothetical protein
MAADPNPEDTVLDLDSEGAIMSADPYRPQAVDPFEMQ